MVSAMVLLSGVHLRDLEGGRGSAATATIEIPQVVPNQTGRDKLQNVMVRPLQCQLRTALPRVKGAKAYGRLWHTAEVMRPRYQPRAATSGTLTASASTLAEL